MMAALFLFMTMTIGVVLYSQKRSLGITLFFVTLALCCLMLFHLAVTPLRINL